MTTFEHAMLGISGTLATGLHRRWGWQVVGMAGVAAVSPDWDALSLLLGPAAFDSIHRVWGHNFLVCLLLGTAIGAIDYRYDVVTRLCGLLRRLPGLSISDGQLQPRTTWSRRGYLVWIATALLAALSHLAADLVVSGTKTLGDWQLQLLWPFSTQGWIFPLVHCGTLASRSSSWSACSPCPATPNESANPPP